MYAQPEARLAWRQVALTLLPAAYLLVNATRVWENVLGLDTATRFWIEQVGLLWLCAALCWLGYVREQRLAVWSFPALGIALVLLLMGASTVPLLFIWGALMVVIAFAAGLGRRLAGRSWEMWLVDLVVLGALTFPLLVPADPRPPVPPANALAVAVTAALWVPQSALFVGAMFCLFSILFAWRLAPSAGLLAGLIPLGNLLFIWSVIGDPAYALGMWTDNRALVDFMGLLPALTFLVATLAVVVVRGRRARIVAYLLPIGAGLLTEAVVDLTLRPHATVGHALTTALLYTLPLLVALWLCARRPASPALPAAPIAA